MATAKTRSTADPARTHRVVRRARSGDQTSVPHAATASSVVSIFAVDDVVTSNSTALVARTTTTTTAVMATVLARARVVTITTFSSERRWALVRDPDAPLPLASERGD